MFFLFVFITIQIYCVFHNNMIPTRSQVKEKNSVWALSLWCCGLYLVFRLLTTPQSLDSHDGTADGNTELQNRQNNQHGRDALQKYLMEHKKLSPLKSLLKGFSVYCQNLTGAFGDGMWLQQSEVAMLVECDLIFRCMVNRVLTKHHLTPPSTFLTVETTHSHRCTYSPVPMSRNLRFGSELMLLQLHLKIFEAWGKMTFDICLDERVNHQGSRYNSGDGSCK